ncbi:hypothetical protein ARMGADRAFT_1028410 [Armillaria gallica]|uniref:Uncharacterized protein n=1 Tax=Armillaria gallica TaxID=47427 RepID=A0A2H3DQ84_ARMGA|nr:hypothetical protein ARMGADRAFT_1028410 [Armillaria gallica]
MGNNPSSRFNVGPGSTRGAAECLECQGRKRNLIESNVECRDWNPTLVIAWVSLGLLLLMAVFIRVRRQCRKIADLESRALHGTVKLPVEDEEDVKSQSMIEVVKDASPA